MLGLKCSVCPVARGDSAGFQVIHSLEKQWENHCGTVCTERFWVIGEISWDNHWLHCPKLMAVWDALLHPSRSCLFSCTSPCLACFAHTVTEHAISNKAHNENIYFLVFHHQDCQECQHSSRKWISELLTAASRDKHISGDVYEKFLIYFSVGRGKSSGVSLCSSMATLQVPCLSQRYHYTRE